MSEFSIKQYQNEVEKIIHFGGTKKETAIRNAFYNLLNEYASQKGLAVTVKQEAHKKAINTLKPDNMPFEHLLHICLKPFVICFL